MKASYGFPFKQNTKRPFTYEMVFILTRTIGKAHVLHTTLCTPEVSIKLLKKKSGLEQEADKTSSSLRFLTSVKLCAQLNKTMTHMLKTLIMRSFRA